MTPASASVIALPLPARPAPESGPFNAHLLNVIFEAPDGRRRSAVGGGESPAEAIAAARGELPSGTEWSVARWSPLFGD